MNMKKLLLWFIVAFFMQVGAMENGNFHHFKKITSIPENNSNFIVSQGQIIDSEIYLNLQSTEFFTGQTFADLIDERNKKKLPLVIAMATGLGQKKDEYTIDFYSGRDLTGYIIQTPEFNRSNISQINFTDTPKLEAMQYFKIDSGDECEYLGSDRDRFEGDKKEFMQNYLTSNLEDPKIQYGLGKIYHYYKQNLKMAKYWYENAAKQNHPKAAIYLGALCNKDESWKQASYWYEQAYQSFKKKARQSDPKAQRYVGYLFSKGYGVDKNYKKSAFWYNKAAQQNDSKAQNNLGYMYLNGLGVDKRVATAIQFYEKSANQGFALAMINLGRFYLDAEDLDKAQFWLQKAKKTSENTKEIEDLLEKIHKKDNANFFIML